MELKACIENRVSTRDFQSVPVEKEKLIQLLDAARVAPSACNLQPWCFVVITDSQRCANLCECYKREWIRSAPVIIVACADHSVSWKRRTDNKDHSDMDLAIAIEHICLTATDLGLGACWVCNFDLAGCKEFLNLPEHVEPVALIPVGYPVKNESAAKNRKSLEEIVRWETY